MRKNEAVLVSGRKRRRTADIGSYEVIGDSMSSDDGNDEYNNLQSKSSTLIRSSKLNSRAKAKAMAKTKAKANKSTKAKEK